MRTAAIYNFLIEANLIAGIAILLMILVRKFLRNQLGNRALCVAWLLVALRLLCPLALPNPLINEIITPYNYDQEHIRPIAGQVRVRMMDAVDDIRNLTMETAVRAEGITYSQAMDKPVYARLDALEDSISQGRAAKAVMAVYLLGCAGVTAWFVIANVKFRRALKKNRVEALSGDMLSDYTALCREKNEKPLPVYLTDPLESACLVGLFRPFIALPLAAGPQQGKQMLAHEMCHYRAGDPVWTLVTLLCCAVHWFNPLVWLAAAMSRMDRELKCDDNVTRDMDEQARKLYAGTLIQSVTRRSVPGMPMLATGMSMTGRKLKTRVGSILRGGKRVKALAFCFVLLSCLLLVCAFGTAEYVKADAPMEETNVFGEEIEPIVIWQNQDYGSVTPFGFVYRPGDDSHQTLKEALSSENAIKDKDAAIARAKEILALPALGLDMGKEEDWRFLVDSTEYGAGNRADWVVVASRGSRSLEIRIAVDGSGVWSVCNAGDPFFANEVLFNYETTKDVELTEEEITALRQFAMDFTEQACPGLSGYYYSLEIMDFVNADGVTYVMLEAPFDSGHSSSQSFTIEMGDTLRMIDFYSGNG